MTGGAETGSRTDESEDGCRAILCGHCGRLRRSDSPWFFCAQCHAVGYCSRKHQRSALAEHRSTCRLPALAVQAWQPQLRTGHPVRTFDDAATELKFRVFSGVGSAWGFRQCWASSRTLRSAVEEYAALILGAPWWLLDTKCQHVLARAFNFCPVRVIVRVACVCRAWKLASHDRAAWRSVRFSFGWGLDTDMHGILRVMRRVAILHNLESFPEDAATEPTSSRSFPRSAPSSPQHRLAVTGSSCKAGLGSWPASPTGYRLKAEVPTTSPLVLCRHCNLTLSECIGTEVPKARDEIWLLQPEEERRSMDPTRHALCRFFSRCPALLAGRAVLEVEAAAGMVGLFASYYSRSVTITTPTELGSRLARINGMLIGTASVPRFKWSGTTKRQSFVVKGESGPVPVYVYALPVTQRGAEDLSRQWQWDSGTAMRGMRLELVAPRFDIICNAAMGGYNGSRLQEHIRGFAQLASILLHEGGHVIVAAEEFLDAPLVALVAQAPQVGLEVEHDEFVQDPTAGCIRILVLRRVAQDLI